MKQQQGPASKELAALRDVRNHLHASDVTVVGFFKNSEEPHFELFETAGLYIYNDIM